MCSRLARVDGEGFLTSAYVRLCAMSRYASVTWRLSSLLTAAAFPVDGLP